MYETQNKKVIGHLAKSDLKSKKMGNGFIMLTIIISVSLLLVMGLFPGSVKLDMQRQLAKAQDGIYMNVSKAQIENLKKDDRIAHMTYDKLGERMEIDDYIIWQIYADGNSKEIQMIDLTEGKLAEKENEVLVTKEYMGKIGKKAKVGTEIEVPFLSGKKEVCVVSGFIKGAENSNVYRIVRSKAYAEKGAALKDVHYDALVKLKNSSDMTQDEFLNELRSVGTKAQVPRSQINENGNFLITLPEGKITPDMMSFAVIGLIILVAGIMVIYSVFYISISGKTRQYGQLRTLGMTRKQVRRLVRREGLLLTLRAVPVGLVLGGLVSYLIKPGGFSAPNTLIAAIIVTAIVLITVLISVMKPARIAASVSPIEASRYSVYTGDGKVRTKTLQRKITPFSLARMNSARNRKKTFVTMLSLGIGGVLFIGAVTFAASVDSEKYARQGEFELGEFAISISGNAIDSAKHGAAELKLDNPLAKNLRQDIEAVPGVKKVYSFDRADIRYDYGDQNGQADFVTPFAKSETAQMKKFLVEGSLDYDEFLSDDKLLIRSNDQVEEIYGWRFKIGDKVTIHYYDGKEKSKTYEVAGDVEDYKDGVSDGWFMLPEEEVAKQLPGVNLTNNWVVSTEQGSEDKVEKALDGFLDKNPNLSMDTLRQHRVESDDVMNQMLVMIIALVLFVVLFSMINLVNTLITNFMSQRTELAMLQSIGMTDRQISKMVMGEGVILAAGNILISLVFGSLLGYGVCRLFGNLGVKYMNYQFPFLYSLIYIAVVIIIPCVIGFFMIRRFRNQSLMERLREV